LSVLQVNVADVVIVIHISMNSFTLIYDDNCPVCRESIDRLRKLDKLGIVKKVGLSEAEEKLPDDFELPDRDRLHEEIHLITPDRKIIRGADAVATVAAMFPRSRWLGKLVMLPGVRTVARWVYRWVARNRQLLSRVLGLPSPQRS
jgi:predicted DCC family thiol-disulfide oxidoreductase YuxK